MKNTYRGLSFFTLLAVLLAPFVTFASNSTNTNISGPDEVFVVYNSSYTTDSNNDGFQDSLEIANYYKTKRGLSNKNVAGVSMPTAQDISRSDYDKYVKAGIEKALTDSGLKDSINYIVLTKGVPMKIYSTSGYNINYTEIGCDCGSVDSALTLLYQTYNSNTDRVVNPYYNIDPNQTLNYRFKNNTYVDTGYWPASELTLKYLVTRLDGYTVADVKSMIDNAVDADTTSSGYFVLDKFKNKNITSFDNKFDNAFNKLKDDKKNLFPSTTQVGKSVTKSAPGNVVAYASYGTYASLPNDYYNKTLNFTYAKGAVASTIESYGTFSMTPPDIMNQGQIAQFIHAGGSGGIGNVYEPYSTGLANVDIWMPAYASGYNWADSAYMSLPYLDWQGVVIGDPLMRINLGPNPILVTGQATGVSQNKATFNFEIKNIGNSDITDYGFQYDKNQKHTSNLWSSQPSGKIKIGKYSKPIETLACGTTYYYRAYVTNQNETVFGDDSAFTTSACTNTVPPSKPGKPTTTSPTKDTNPVFTFTESKSPAGVSIREYQGIYSDDINFANNVIQAGFKRGSRNVLNSVTPGTWYFKTRAVDMNGLVSEYSDIGSVVVTK